MILLGMHSEIGKQILLRREKKNQIRTTDISKLRTALGKEVYEALVGVHAWTVDVILSPHLRARER